MPTFETAITWVMIKQLTFHQVSVMRVALLIIPLLSFSFNVKSQTIYENEISPNIEFSYWINKAEGNQGLAGKHIVLEFWTSWCKPCLESMPRIAKLSKKYKEDFVFVWVNSSQTIDQVEKVVKDRSIKSPVAIDSASKLYKAFEVYGVPTAILIDKNGQVRWKGISSLLTESLIQDFIQFDTLIDQRGEDFHYSNEYSISTSPTNKGINQNDTVIQYSLLVERAETGQPRTLTWGYDSGIYLKLSNYGFHGLSITLTSLVRNEYEWKVIGDVPENFAFDITIISDADSSYEKAIVSSVLSRLPEFFNYRLDTVVKNEKRYFLTPVSDKYKNYLSENSDGPSKTVKTDSSYQYQRIYIKNYASQLGRIIKRKVDLDENFQSGYYELELLKEENIRKVNIFLQEKYGLILLKRKVEVKTCVMVFKDS
jgi:thiol-disulfide isomerase/thioredoxin